MTEPNPMNCQQCGAAVDTGRIFCKHCGATLQAPAPLTSSKDEPDSGVPQVRPWVRFWARMLDVYLFSFLVGISQVIYVPRTLSHGILGGTVYGMVILFLWIFIESLLLTWFGTTPGKSLLKTRLKFGNNTSIPFPTALARSFKVWLRGLGAGIPIIYLITLSNSDNDLTQNSITSWDGEGGFAVIHERIGKSTIAIATACLFVFTVLSVAGLLVENGFIVSSGG